MHWWGSTRSPHPHPSDICRTVGQGDREARSNLRGAVLLIDFMYIFQSVKITFIQNLRNESTFFSANKGWHASLSLPPERLSAFGHNFSWLFISLYMQYDYSLANYHTCHEASKLYNAWLANVLPDLFTPRTYSPVTHLLTQACPQWLTTASLCLIKRRSLLFVYPLAPI